MPVLHRFLHSAERGRRWRAGEEGHYLWPMGSLAAYPPQSDWSWELPQIARAVKLIWRSKGGLQGPRPREQLEPEPAPRGVPDKLHPDSLREKIQVWSDDEKNYWNQLIQAKLYNFQPSQDPAY